MECPNVRTICCIALGSHEMPRPSFQWHRLRLPIYNLKTCAHGKCVFQRSVRGTMTLLLTAAGLLLSFYLYQLLSDPLRVIPGPFWARFSRFWELIQTRRSHFEEVNINLHKRYGKSASRTSRKTTSDHIFHQALSFVCPQAATRSTTQPPQNRSMAMLLNSQKQSSTMRWATQTATMQICSPSSTFIDTARSAGKSPRSTR